MWYEEFLNRGGPEKYHEYSFIRYKEVIQMHLLLYFVTVLARVWVLFWSVLCTFCLLVVFVQETRIWCQIRKESFDREKSYNFFFHTKKRILEQIKAPLFNIIHPHEMCQKLFDDKRIITAFILVWTILSSIVFCAIMLDDNSPFLNFGPSDRTVLFGVKLNTWGVWWCVAIYTFVSTAVAAYASDSIVPWITNTVQDHKTRYIPYNKWTCWAIIQIFTCYAVIMSVIGLFVALSQIDFMVIRLVADLMVNHYTTFFFLKGKTVNLSRYNAYNKPRDDMSCSDGEIPDDCDLLDTITRPKDPVPAPKSDEIV